MSPPRRLDLMISRSTEPCRPGSVKFAGHCYQLLDGERSRQNASDSCRRLGGTLVSIESAVENNFVTCEWDRAWVSGLVRTDSGGALGGGGLLVDGW